MESVAHNKPPLIFDDNVTLSDQVRVQKFLGNLNDALLESIFMSAAIVRSL